MHQLNLEILEQKQPDLIFEWVLKSDTPIPNSDKLISLFSKAKPYLKNSFSSPKTLQYRKLTDEKKQYFRTDRVNRTL